MGCFVVPVTEAIVTTVAAKVLEKREKKQMAEALEHGANLHEINKVKLSTHLKRLNGLLWGGSVLLAFEHVWHGELTPMFPFLTGASNPAEMFEEMATVGVGMSVLVTAVWAVSTLVLTYGRKQENASLLKK